MSTRLTQSDKREIISILMNKARNAREERIKVLEAEKYAIGDEIYAKAVYTERQHELMAELGDKFFKHETDYGISVDGKYLRLFLSEPKPLAIDDVGYRKAIIELADRPELVAKVAQLEADENALNTELRQLEQDISATVNRATTNKRLIDIWPDIEDVVAQVCPEVGVTTAVAIPINRLNLAIEGKVKSALEEQPTTEGETNVSI